MADPEVGRGGPQILESPEEVLSTLTLEGKRRWLYPVPAKGKHLRRRLLAAWALVAVYLLLPIVHIGDHPAVLLDFVRREFALFGVVFYPTDTALLMIGGISFVLAIIIFTALLGRVWCGWACPQTVYLEFVFRPIERWIEGAEHVRKRRDEGPWSWDKVWRKLAKMTIYSLISLLLAHTFVAYFVGWEALFDWVQGDPRDHWGFFVMMGLTSGLILFDFGYFREQMCTIVCPYARMQSVLLDPDSLIVSYDPNRGEPRARRSKRALREEAEGLIPARGDCIDCGACVRTCPTGIDIRDGLQMECIACTQCIDACDDIMINIGKQTGLIRYTSENTLDGRPTRALRPRTILYTSMLVVLLGFFTAALVSREAYDVNVGRISGQPFTVLPDGRVANRLRFRVRNQTREPGQFEILGRQPEAVQINVVGATPVDLLPGEMKRIEAWVVVDAGSFVRGSASGVFELQFGDGSVRRVNYELLGPLQ
jgi:cytochrome c oxidase accessory protein FixG